MLTEKQSDFLKRINSGQILLGDGAMGTMLIERGLSPGEPPELFNIKQPEVITEISSKYLKAGADIIQTNTFGASPLKLSMFNLEGRTEEIIINAVSAVRKTSGSDYYLSGTCGPTGKILKPYGDTSRDEVYNSFKKQMEILFDTDVDIICIETMTDLMEMKEAIQAARTISKDIPIIATMTFDSTPGGFYTVMGNSIEEVTRELENSGADVIGSNCGNGIENMIEIAKEFRKFSDLPVIIQSNAGVPEISGGKTIYPETPEYMAEKSRELINLGVSIIGGCCGTTPAHITEIKATIEKFNSIEY